jgi:multicomponent Na+:H+ antiporter subunit A
MAALIAWVTFSFFANGMAGAIIGEWVLVEISALPHLSVAFALSLFTLLLGALAFWGLDTLRDGIAATLARIGWGPDRGFDQAMRGLVRLATVSTRLLQNGRLDVYITIAFVAIAAALLLPMLMFGEMPSLPAWPDLLLHEWAVIIVALVGLVTVLRTNNRLTAIVSLGIQGFAVAVLFMLMGAPDLSFTQFMVEVLSVSILALVMTRLRLMPADKRPWRDMGAEAALSVAGGLGLALFLLAIVQRPFDTAVTDFYERYSYTIAHGRNIVNVILVDFRGVDTMGEIAVVLTTGAAILALVRIRAAKPDARHSRKRRRRAGELQA